MFSATYSDDIRELASRFVRNPVSVEVTPRNATADKVEQSAYRVPKEHKRHLLAHLINEGNWHQVLVFTRTKHGANRLAQQLERAGINAMAIHGNKSQNARVQGAAGLQGQPHHGAGGHRSRRARPRHQGAAARRELRAAERAGGLRAPHRPHGARRLDRRGHFAGVAGRGGVLLRDIEKLLKRQVEFVPTPKFEIKEGTHTPRAERDGEPASTSRTRIRAAVRASPPARRQWRRGRHGGQRQGGWTRAPGTANHDSYSPQGAQDGGTAEARAAVRTRRSMDSAQWSAAFTAFAWQAIGR